MRLARNLGLLAALLLLSVACAGPARRPPAGRPNVIVVLIDCLRADHVGVNGSPRPTTPTLDTVASEGVDFTHAYAQASWTRPSVPTILTGLYPSEHGLIAFEQEGGVVESPVLAPSITTVAEAVKAAGYETALIGEQHQLSPQFGLNQGFDVYHNHAGTAPNIDHRFLEWLGDGRKAPFFAYLHYLDIHWPYCPPAATAGRFQSGKSRIDFCAAWRRLRGDILSGKVRLSAEDRYDMEARYDEELLALDRRLGDLFGALRAAGIWDDTLVVVTADHGEEFFEHGAIGHGQSLYDELLHVPLVVKPPTAWPGPRGIKVDDLVELRDIAPTVLEAAHATEEPPLSAPSLVPYLIGSPPSRPQSFTIAESVDQVALRTRDWKLLVDRKSGSLTLFDLAHDPGETRDVAAENRRVLATLRGDLQQALREMRPTPGETRRALDPETLRGLSALGYLDEDRNP